MQCVSSLVSSFGSLFGSILKVIECLGTILIEAHRDHNLLKGSSTNYVILGREGGGGVRGGGSDLGTIFNGREAKERRMRSGS